MEGHCTQVEEKFSMLLSLLKQLPSRFEMIADEIDNEQLKHALCAVAVETDQYAFELKQQFKRFDLTLPKAREYHVDEFISTEEGLEVIHGNGREIALICERCEAFFSALYLSLLNDYFPNNLLKDMMQYQLTGIRSAFFRIRFLNSLRFSN